MLIKPMEFIGPERHWPSEFEAVVPLPRTIAAAAGLNPKTLKNWVFREHVPSHRKLAALAHGLNGLLPMVRMPFDIDGLGSVGVAHFPQGTARASDHFSRCTAPNWGPRSPRQG